MSRGSGDLVSNTLETYSALIGAMVEIVHDPQGQVALRSQKVALIAPCKSDVRDFFVLFDSLLDLFDSEKKYCQFKAI